MSSLAPHASGSVDPYAPAASAAVVPLPEAIFWKQSLFLIPYQWNSAADAGAAQAVHLYVSKDRGATWQRISEAQPHVKAFNYHAEGDGEYWFAIRTIDARGAAWPAGPYQPELRVMVDTTMPRIALLECGSREDGMLEIRFRASDANLDPLTWTFEVQSEPSGPWSPVAIDASSGALAESGQTMGTPPPGLRPIAVRATVFDRAGNSATFRSEVRPGRLSGDAPIAASGGSAAIRRLPPVDSAGGTTGIVATEPVDVSEATQSPSGWVSGSATANNVKPQNPPATTQPWPGDALPRERYQLSSSDGQSAYAPVEPFRSGGASEIQSPNEPRWVSSRTFAVEYDVEQVGRWGVSAVELWGTRDGGQTWHRYARDDDNRSPVYVTVDGEGLYGFRIVVESGSTAVPPRSGDRPELWVGVDLQRPRAELTSVQPGSGNLADQLVLQWQAEDANLSPRPVSLFYSSRSAGPWSAIVTNLENTGEYAWRVERHVPSRFYLRLEARDEAGNVTAYQTSEPVVFDLPQPAGQIRAVSPVGTREW